MNGDQRSPIEKFQGLLRELFQFDCADLDFGIYRIMNHKRNVVERFISTKLPETVEAELNRGTFARQAEAKAVLDEARQQVIELLGPDALDANENVATEALAGTPIAKAYLDARARAGVSRRREPSETDVYNHLYAFFNRYYHDGDFISERRYSRNHRYAIPYNGEEVYLHWANSDQYYIKTAEHFHSYQWKSPTGVTVHFRVDAANVEQDNVKGERRFFVPRVKDAEWQSESRSLSVPFDYRPLTRAEQAHSGNGNQQDKIIAAALEDLPKHVGNPDALAALAAERGRREGEESVTCLEYHLRQYTRRNDSDFFVHKDLRGFLLRELDFYIKNEILSLHDLTAAGEDAADGWFQLLRLVRTIGGQIIDFLAQIEGFQKMLWEKRKLVVDAQYCVRLAHIPSSLYADILANDSQWDEWEEMLGVSDSSRSPSFIASRPSLMVDTGHFDSDFTDRLLASLDDIDELTDGLLIQGENWQAIRLIENRFHGAVECLYLDPPYNTGDSEILYKNGYLSSSWLTMMDNRLSVSMGLLSRDPTIFVAIDDFEMADLCMLMDMRLPWLRREMIVVNHHPQGGKASTLSTTHEYMLTCVRAASKRTLLGRQRGTEVERRPFKRSGTAESNFRYARPNSFYAVLVDRATNTVAGLEPPPAPDADYPTDDTEKGHARVYPLGTGGEERVWRRSFESCQTLVEDSKLVCSAGQTVYQLIDREDRTPALFSNWTDSRYNAGTLGANLLADIMGRHNPFPYPKSLHTVGDAVFAADLSDGYCMDFFAGSGTTGHAVINLNREDGRRRKFILVEAGEHFDTVLLPRLKKVSFAPDWKDGKPSREASAEEVARAPRIIKYMRLETYEDALDSIEFDQRAGELTLEDKIEGYLLNYVLKWETKDSATLLNPVELAAPFKYRLRVHTNGDTVERPVSVAETFNYLLGLKVTTRRVYMDEDRRYLVFRGEMREQPGSSSVVIWRDTVGWDVADLERDRHFVAENGITDGAGAIYVNGMSNILDGRSIEPLFKERMFASVSDPSTHANARTNG